MSRKGKARNPNIGGRPNYNLQYNGTGSTFLQQAFFQLILAKGQPEEQSFHHLGGPNRVASVDFQVDEKKLNSCKFNLVNVKMSTIESNALQEDREFVFQYGIKNIWTAEHKLVIKEVEVKYEKTIRAVVTGYDDRIQSVQVKGGSVWAGRTASFIATDIAKKMGWKTTGIKPTTRIYTNLVQGHKSYSQILADLAWQENFRFLVEENVLIFEPAYDLSTAKGRVYTYWVGGKNKTSSVESFEVKSKTTPNVTAEGAGVKSSSQDSVTGDPNNSNSSKTPTVGKRSFNVTYNPGGGYSGQWKTPDPPANPSGATDPHPDPGNRANAAETKAAWKMVEAVLHLINEPVHIEDVINIQGCSSRHVGNYKVTKVDMKINGGTLRVDAHLSRDTTNPANNGKKDTANQTPNGPGSANSAPQVKVKYIPGGGYTVQRP